MMRRDFVLERAAKDYFFALKLCVYTHTPLPLVAGHCFGLWVVGGVCHCSMDGCTAFWFARFAVFALRHRSGVVPAGAREVAVPP